MKIKKRYIIIPIVMAILIVTIGAGIVGLDRISQKKQIEKDEKNYGNNYQKLNSNIYTKKPDRIVYKPKERDVFYIFDKIDEDYSHLLEVTEDRMFYSQTEDFNLTCFTPDSMDRIMSSGENYIIFDYDTESESKPIIFKFKDNNRLQRLVTYLCEFRKSYSRDELGKDEFTYERTSGYVYMTRSMYDD